MTPRQEKVLLTLRDADDSLTIAEMARRAFPGVRPFTKAKSWVRNQLRGLVVSELVERVDRGRYAARRTAP